VSKASLYSSILALILKYHNAQAYKRYSSGNEVENNPPCLPHFSSPKTSITVKHTIISVLSIVAEHDATDLRTSSRSSKSLFWD
jgi:hypothetical protein